MPADWSQLEHFQKIGATFLYFPLDWLIDKALKDLHQSLDITEKQKKIQLFSILQYLGDIKSGLPCIYNVFSVNSATVHFKL